MQFMSQDADWSIGPLQCIGSFLHSSIRPLVHWSTGPLFHWSIGPMFHWSIVPLVHCSIGPLVHWTIRLNFCRSVPPEFLRSLFKWCDTWWSQMGNFCPSNFMAIFSKDAFLPVSQKIKFAHYWISDRRKMRRLGSFPPDKFLEKSQPQVSYVKISGW